MASEDPETTKAPPPHDRVLLDALPMGMMVHRDGVITYANKLFAEIVGRPLESLAGMPFTSLVAPEEVDKLLSRYARRLRGEVIPTEYETTCVRPDGTRRAIALSVAVHDPYFTVIVRDVTDRIEKRARRFALAHLGAAIAAQDTPMGIHGAVRDGLARVGLAATLLVPDGDSLKVAWVHCPGDVLDRFVTLTGRDPQALRRSGLRWIDHLWREGEVYADDAVAAIANFVGGEAGEVARALAIEARMFRAVAARIMVGGEPVGVIVAAGEWLREDDLAAVHLLGQQIGAGLQNARVLAGTRRRLHDLESLHGLARRVLAATNEEPHALVAAACESIAHALDARWAAAHILADGGNTLRWVATWNEGTATTLPGEIALTDSPALMAVVHGTTPLLLADTAIDPASCVRGETELPHGRGVVLPVRSGRGALGLVTVAGTPDRSFGDGEVAVAAAMVALLGLGLENAELLAEVRRRLREISTVFEVGRAVAGSLDLQRVLDEGCEALRSLLDASHVFVLLYDPAKGEVRGAAGSAGVGPDFLEVRRPIDGHGLTCQTIRTRQTYVSEDAANDPRVNRELRERYAEKSLLFVPLMRRDEPVGVVVVDECRAIRRFSDSEIQRAVLISNQLAVAIDNARLYDEIRKSYRELAAAQAQLVQRERLAALGELAAVVAHEVRNPLAVIFNTVGALGRVFSTTVGNEGAMLLAILQEEADRLNRIVGDLLDFVRPVRPAVCPERLDQVIDEALATAMSGETAMRVELVRDFPRNLAPVPMDARLVRQAVVNLAHNALQAMPTGGRLKVEARTEAPWARIEMTDTGPGIVPEVMRQMFEPFFTTKATGTGLGLAVVKRIVDGHGGDVHVESAPGQGTRFTLRLPLDARAVMA